MPISGYFDTIFGSSGDLATVPDAAPIDGTVSYESGYGADYSLPNTDPDFKNPERDKMNQIFYDVTAAIQQLQQYGAPPFITSVMNGGSPFSYSKNARVITGGVVYQSLVNSNTTTPPSSSWVVDSSNPLFQGEVTIASAATTDLASGGSVGLVAISGTTTITSFGSNASTSQPIYMGRFTGALTLTHNATSLILPSGANIITVAGDSFIAQYLGSGNWKVLSYSPIYGNAVKGNPIMYVREDQVGGTDGGTFTAGSFATRVLNTTSTNEIAGASLSANQITLPAGSYIIQASAPAYQVLNHQCKLQNITAGSTQLLGTNEYSPVGGSQTSSRIFGKITITSTTVFALQHRCNTTKATNGLGIAASFSPESEIYGQVIIEKVG